MFSGKPRARPKAISTFLAWRGSKRSTRALLSPFNQPDFQIPHEPAGGKPEIIPHHHDRLDMLAIAVPKSGDQFRVLFASLAWSHCSNWSRTSSTFRSGGKMRPLRKFASESTSPNPLGSSGQTFRKPLSNRASVSSGVASM